MTKLNKKNKLIAAGIIIIFAIIAGLILFSINNNSEDATIEQPEAVAKLPIWAEEIGFTLPTGLQFLPNESEITYLASDKFESFVFFFKGDDRQELLDIAKKYSNDFDLYIEPTLDVNNPVIVQYVNAEDTNNSLRQQGYIVLISVTDENILRISAINVDQVQESSL